MTKHDNIAGWCPKCGPVGTCTKNQTTYEGKGTWKK